MQYRKYESKTFDVHTIKTDKFKNCVMEVLFTKNIKKEEITEMNFLVDVLASTNNTYKTRRDVVLKLESLYNMGFRGVSNRVGNAHMVSFITNFLNPKYCDEGHLEEVLDFSFDMLLNPNVTNDEFDLKTFNIEKSRLTNEIKSLKENCNRYALRRCMINIDESSPISYNISGYLEDLEKITPSNLYETYKRFINEYKCNIYIIGDLDMDEVFKLINKKLKLDTIKDYDIPLYVDNKIRSKVNVVKEIGDYKQSTLIMAYNTVDLTKKEKDAVIHILVCQNCGESRWWLLDFHHVDPSQKEGEISKLVGSPNKLKEELSKCVVLCANCHRDLHYKLEHISSKRFDSDYPLY